MKQKPKIRREIIRQLQISSVLSPQNPIIFDDTPRVCLVVEKGKSLLVFHRTTSDVEVTVDLTLQEKSTLTYVFLSDGAGAKLRSSISASANMTWYCFTVGSDATYDLESEIIGADATSQINWVFRAAEKEKQTIGITNNFKAKNGGGEIVLKGVAEDHAQVACNGMIEIGLQGGGTKTHLTEDVLMLDATAKVDAIPGLEIKTNDVKASHSATVSRVTPEQLFYLQSRGLPEETARKLFIDGFLGEILEQIEDENIRAVVLKNLL